MATSTNQKSKVSSPAGTGEKPSLILFGGLAVIALFKDLLDFIGIGSLPVLGTAVTLCFSFLIFMLLVLFDRSGGRGNKRLAQGMVMTFFTLVEAIIPILNFLPFETFTIIFLYNISHRSWKESQKAMASSNRALTKKQKIQQAQAARAMARQAQAAAQGGESAETIAAPPQERAVRAPRMTGFSEGSSLIRQPGRVAATPSSRGVSAASSTAAFSGAAMGGVAVSTGSLARPTARPAAPSIGLNRTASQSRDSGAARPREAASADPFPIVKSDHGYAIDIGGGEIYGEYRSPEEAKRSMPEAVRSRDARQAYLSSRATNTTSPTDVPTASADVGSIALGAAEPNQNQSAKSLVGNQTSTPAGVPLSAARPTVGSFDAKKEIAGLRAIPKAERRTKLTEIKEKLSYQTTGLARVQAGLFATIRSNPNASYDDLHGELMKQGAAYGLNDEQEKIGSDVLKKYIAKHEQIQGLRNKHPDDRDLFKTLFGRPPKGAVEIVEGPMTFYFKCHDVNDFALIHSQSFVDGRQPTPGEIETASRYGGLAGITTLVPGISGSILAENSSHEIFQKSPEQSDIVRTHEEQHEMNHLFAAQFDEARDVINRFHEVTTRGEKEVAVEDYLRYFQAQAEEGSRDEILAYFKDGRSFDQILTTLSLKKDEGGGYDFLVDNRAAAEYHVEALFGQEFQQFAKIKAEKMYDTEYRDHLKTALQSVERLTKAGYNRDEAIALLIHEPLSRWDKVTSRLFADPKTTPQKNPQVSVGVPAIAVATANNNQPKASPTGPVQAATRTVPGAASPQTQAPARTAFRQLKDISNDASARIREAGSRLSQLARPKSVSAHITPPVAAPARPSNPPTQKAVPVAPVLTKERLFQTRLMELRQNPLARKDDSQAVENLFQTTPEFRTLAAQQGEITKRSADAQVVQDALRAYLGTKADQRSMQGSGKFWDEDSQKTRYTAANRLRELGRKEEDLNETRVAESYESNKKTFEYFRSEKERLDREIAGLRSKFGSSLQRDYAAWIEQQKSSKRAV